MLWIFPIFFSSGNVPAEVLQITPVQVETTKVIILVKTNSEKRILHSPLVYSFSNKTEQQFRQPEKLDINKADSVSLERLPGIGEKLSSRIVRYRDRLGGFISIDQLREVYGLSDSTFKLVSQLLYVSKTFIPLQIQANTAEYAEFRRHPYIKTTFLKAFLAYRKTHGYVDFQTCENIALQVGDTLHKNMKAYLNFTQ